MKLARSAQARLCCRVVEVSRVAFRRSSGCACLPAGGCVSGFISLAVVVSIGRDFLETRHARSCVRVRVRGIRSGSVQWGRVRR